MYGVFDGAVVASRGYLRTVQIAVPAHAVTKAKFTFAQHYLVRARILDSHDILLSLNSQVCVCVCVSHQRLC